MDELGIDWLQYSSLLYCGAVLQRLLPNLFLSLQHVLDHAEAAGKSYILPDVCCHTCYRSSSQVFLNVIMPCCNYLAQFKLFDLTIYLSLIPCCCLDEGSLFQWQIYNITHFYYI